MVTFTLGLGSSTPLTLGLGGTDAAGALTPISLTIPVTAPAGQAAITAQDSAGEQVTTPFTVIHPSLALSPAAARAAIP